MSDRMRELNRTKLGPGMSKRMLTGICIFAVVFFTALLFGDVQAAGQVFDVPLQIKEIPGTAKRGTLDYETKRSGENKVHVLFYWTSPVTYSPGVVSVQCKALGTGDENTTFAAYSWHIVPRSIDDHYGMLTLHVDKGTAVKIVECHWMYEGPDVPAGKANGVTQDSQF
jgi:hypothetical protein